MKCKCGKAFFQRTTIQNCCSLCALKSALSTPKKEKKTPFNWKKPSDKPVKKGSKSLARDVADKYFSRYIRLVYAFENNGELFCKCFTSGNIFHIKNIDAGHFITRGNGMMRYNEDNVRPQGRQDNRFKQGRHDIFEKNLIKEIGQEAVDSLKRLADERGEDNEAYYKEVAEHFRVKVKELQEQKGIKIW